MATPLTSGPLAVSPSQREGRGNGPIQRSEAWLVRFKTGFDHLEREKVWPPGVSVFFILCFLVLAAFLGVLGILGIRRDVFSAAGLNYTLLASTSFVAIGVVGLAAGRGRRFGLLMLGGLVFCWLGDFLGPQGFMYGLAAFFVGHCFFICAFAGLGVEVRKAAWAAVFYLSAGVVISVWLLPHVPLRDAVPVGAYMAVISVMAVTAFGARARRGGWLLSSGAFLFYVSDIFVARWRFVAQDSLNPLLCYPLYYAACVLLALSVYALLPVEKARGSHVLFGAGLSPEEGEGAADHADYAAKKAAGAGQHGEE